MTRWEIIVRARSIPGVRAVRIAERPGVVEIAVKYNSRTTEEMVLLGLSEAFHGREPAGVVYVFQADKITVRERLRMASETAVDLLCLLIARMTPLAIARWLVCRDVRLGRLAPHVWGRSMGGRTTWRRVG